MTSEYTITQQHRELFHEKGAILLPSVVNDEQLTILQRAADQSLAKSENYFHRLRVWEDDPTLKSFCLDSQAPEIIAQLLETNRVNLFYDQVFTKEPGTAAPTPWHNDLPYWPIRGPGVVTFWLALDHIVADSGALELIAGSHRWDRWFQPFQAALDGGVAGTYPTTDSYFEPLPDFDADRDNLEILRWEMNPGDVIVFHGLTVHGARGNISSSKRRRGYAIRYAGADVRYYHGPANNPRLVNPELHHGDRLDSGQYPVAYMDRR